MKIDAEVLVAFKAVTHDAEQAIKEAGGCDHSVGICMCKEIRHVQISHDIIKRAEAQEAIEKVAHDIIEAGAMSAYATFTQFIMRDNPGVDVKPWDKLSPRVMMTYRQIAKSVYDTMTATEEKSDEVSMDEVKEAFMYSAGDTLESRLKNVIDKIKGR